MRRLIHVCIDTDADMYAADAPILLAMVMKHHQESDERETPYSPERKTQHQLHQGHDGVLPATSYSPSLNVRPPRSRLRNNMQDQSLKEASAVESCAHTSWYAALCASLAPKVLPHTRAASAVAGPETAALVPFRMLIQEQSACKAMSARLAGSLLLYWNKPALRVREMREREQQQRCLYGADSKRGTEAASEWNACRRRFCGSRTPIVLLFLCVFLLYCPVRQPLLLCSPSLTMSLAHQLRMYSGPAAPVLRPLAEPANSAAANSAQVVAESIPQSHQGFSSCSSLASSRPIFLRSLQLRLRAGLPVAAAAAAARSSRCVAHVSLPSPRTSVPNRCLPESESCSMTLRPAPFFPTSTASSSAARAGARPAVSAKASSDTERACLGMRAAAGRVQPRHVPAASLPFSASFPSLRHMRVPHEQAQVHQGDENESPEAPPERGCLRLVKQQLQLQVQQHQAEIRSLLGGVLQMALQCLRSLWGVYFLGLSFLVLPLCSSARPYFEVLNRVPLNDPYFLRHLNLPEDASPALFGLNFYDVNVPPLVPSGPSAYESPTFSRGRGADSAQYTSSSATSHMAAPESPPAQRSPQDEATAPAPPGSRDILKRAAEKEASAFGDSEPGSNYLQEENQHLQKGRPASAGALRGWLVPAEQRETRKGIVCAHGWLANRQACLPFLGVARKAGLHKDHHILLFDLKSSGESSSALTQPRSGGWLANGPRIICSQTVSGNGGDQLGCQAAEDLLQAIMYLRNSCGITTVSLYAQGVSAMGAMVLLGEFRDHLQRDWGITIDKVIFESPICSARDALQTQPLASCLAKTAAWLHEALIWTVTKERARQLCRLRASRLLRSGKPYKLLIFSSREDKLAPWPSVRREMLQLPEQDRPEFIYVFATGAHCDLVRKHQRLYADVVQKFYKNPSVVQSIWQKLTGAHAPVTGFEAEVFTPRDFTAAAAAAAESTESNVPLPSSTRSLSAAAASLLHFLSAIRFEEHSSE